jgi:glutathione-regulated potassium-efflux system ancillary protein KefG
VSPRRILVLFAHPVLERSRVNRRLLDGIRDLAGVTVHDLYEAYPALELNVRREQALLVEHEVIVFQHPFYWYSTPAILKEWQDLVLEHGWAYGSQGTQLQGKLTLNVVSTGGPAEAYRAGGYNRFTVRQLLAPYDQTALLCGMRFLAPFVVHGSLFVLSPEQAEPYVKAYRMLLEALRDDRVDLEAAAAASQLSTDLTSILRKGAA